MPPPERSLVFNVVWTGTSFDGLQHFVTSLLAHSRARFRFVANGCPPDQVAALEGYRARAPDRVVEVLDVSAEMVAHGQALDRVRELRDDGEWFAFVDPDIKANAPFVDDLATVLDDADVVTSGKEVWSTTNVLPEGYWGVAGEYFYDQDGFVFGSPHLAIYRRSVLDETCERWGVGLGSAGPELTDEARAHLAGIGRTFKVYDTAKVVNCLLQADGHRLLHRELDQLVHIGGMAHYLSPSAYLTNDEGELVPEWTRWDNMGERHQVARFTASVLRGQLAGEPVPELPGGLEPAMEAKLSLARDEVVDLIARYRHGPGASGPTAPDPPAAGDPSPPGSRLRRTLRRRRDDLLAVPRSADTVRFWASVRSRHPRFVRAVAADARITASNRGERFEHRSGLDAALQAVRLALITDAFLAQCCYRAKAALQARGVPFVPRLLHRLAVTRGQVAIGDPVVVEAGVFLPHGQVCIDGMTRIGAGTVIGPFVTIGLVSGEVVGPTIGERVRIGTGARILGPVEVGDGAAIGANAVVLDDVAPGVTVVGAPARPVDGRGEGDGDVPPSGDDAGPPAPTSAARVGPTPG